MMVMVMVAQVSLILACIFFLLYIFTEIINLIRQEKRRYILTTIIQMLAAVCMVVFYVAVFNT